MKVIDRKTHVMKNLNIKLCVIFCLFITFYGCSDTIDYIEQVNACHLSHDITINIDTYRDPYNTLSYPATRSSDNSLFEEKTVSTNETVIFPQFYSLMWLGNTFYRNSVANCSYKPIIGNKKGLTASLSLSNTNYSYMENPSLVTYNQYLSKELKRATFNGDDNIDFTIDQFTYYQELKTAFGSNTNTDVLFWGTSSTSATTTHKISKRSGLYIKFWQTSFVSTMDDPDIPFISTTEQLMDSAVFINSITYGRLGIIAIETNYDINQARDLLQKSFHAILFGGKESLTDEENRFLRDCDCRIYIQGGAAKLAVQTMNGLDAFVNYVKHVNFSYSQPGVPIFCSFENVSDNSLAKINFKFNFKKEPIYAELIDSINTAVNGEMHHLSLSFYRNKARFPEIPNPSIEYKIKIDDTPSSKYNPTKTQYRTFSNKNYNKYIKAFSFLGKHKDVIYKRRFNGFTLTRKEEYTTTAKLCDSESYEIIGENPTKIYYYDKKHN